MGRTMVMVSFVAATLTLVAAGGCGGPRAYISRAAGGEDETVRYDSATFQLARGRRVQVILFRRTPAPIGEADPDFDYVYFELPERKRFGWVRQDRLPIYRWVRKEGRDQVWLSASGEARMKFGDYKQHMHFEFHVTMAPVGETGGSPYLFSGQIKCREDVVRTQGLMNRYGEWLESLVAPRSGRRDALR